MKLGISLSDVDAGCSKPECGHRAPCNRHHKSHEALWLGAWAHRGVEPKWIAFVERYYEFREEDCVKICLPHHAEIHALYDEIIADDVARTGIPLYLYSWKQGEILMTRLRTACDLWLQSPSPGLDSAEYERNKKLRRALLKRRARRRHPQKEGHRALAAQRGDKLKREKKRRRRKKRTGH